MDLKLLADALVIALAPVLPHLVTGSTEAGYAFRSRRGLVSRVDVVGFRVVVLHSPLGSEPSDL